jgi:hypothetical protein
MKLPDRVGRAKLSARAELNWHGIATLNAGAETMHPRMQPTHRR